MSFENKPLQALSITAPGFFGLNKQDAPVNMNTSYALTANNAVIDRFGRIGARKGWVYKTTTGGSGSNIDAIMEFDNFDGTYTIISAGNNKIYTGETTLTQMPVRNSNNTADLTYTITSSDWQMVQAQYASGATRSAHGYLVQRGYPPLVYHKLPSGGGGGHSHSGLFGFQRLADVGSIPAAYSATTFTPGCALAAYGRLWVANIDDDDCLTVYYSVSLDTSDFTGTGSGVLNIEKVVSKDDKIVALAAHNNFLVIFCQNTTVVYAKADDVSNIVLSDVINGIGCIARDTVQNIGTDILFLSNSGVRSLGRTIQEKSAPVKDVTRNVRDELLAYLAGENKAKIRSVYFEPEAFYVLTLPSATFAYCIDLRQQLEDGSNRVTFWNNITPRSFCSTINRRLLIGKADGIAEYTGYTDNGASYIFSYYSPYLDFQSPSITKMLKKIGITVVGGQGTTFDIRWAYDYQGDYKTVRSNAITGLVSEYGIAQYNIDEYSSSVFIDNIKKQLSGSGNVVQIGIDSTISGNAVSIQKIDIYAVAGRTI
jgi:hypothetical protein